LGEWSFGKRGILLEREGRKKVLEEFVFKVLEQRSQS